MKVLSVNVGQEQRQPKRDEFEITGIYKLPTGQPVQVHPLGLPGDFIGDLRNHGGPDQAVYVYGERDYAWWSERLGRKLEPGTFGENLTISDFESAPARIGDQLQIGSVVLELTAPRIPCGTLARRMRDPMFTKAYRHAERPGVYCRVIEEGELKQGDPVVLIPSEGPTVSNVEVFRTYFERKPDAALLHRILAAPISVRLKDELEEKLARLGS